MKRNDSRAGSALIGVLVFLGVMALAASFFLIQCSAELNMARLQMYSLRAYCIAEAGINDCVNDFSRAFQINVFPPYFSAFPDDATSMQDFNEYHGSSASGGVFSVDDSIDPIAFAEGSYRAGLVSIPYPTTANTDYKNVELRAIGTVTDPTTGKVYTRTINATYFFGLKPAKVFDYAYFMNNWGWHYGNSIKTLGNNRANGHFDCGNYKPYHWGRPTFDRVDSDTHDHIDNIDDGGDYTPMNFFQMSNVRGTVGESFTATVPDEPGFAGGGNQTFYPNQHQNETDEDADNDGVIDVGEDRNGNSTLDEAFDRNGSWDADEDHVFDTGESPDVEAPEVVPMPNLNDMGWYEGYAEEHGSSIVIEGAGEGGSDLVVSDGVVGDEVEEAGDLFLVGTEANPIRVSGPNVVRGNLAITGVVTGQGSIYVKKNIYIPEDIAYADPPEEFESDTWLSGTTVDAAAYETYVEQWRSDNEDADALGLFAAENIVVGDYKNSSWRSYVSSWLNHSWTESAETNRGWDCMPNTNDADEDNSTWEVTYYTQEDEDRGRIPEGFDVGDPVPGTGEDIDGDGVEDARISLDDFDMSGDLYDLTPGAWDGNPPSPDDYDDYSDFATYAGVNQLDALIYTNHAFAGRVGSGGGFDVNGGLISRIESIIYNDHAYFSHDERFTGGGDSYGFYLPRIKAKPDLLVWKEIESES